MTSDHPVKRRKKLIEVAIPLEAINAASAREKSIRHGHPSTLHLWWARRPLAAARAVIFCQMVDDPSAVPEEFPTEEDQEKERLRLFKLISELVLWESTTNEEVLGRAREEIRRSWRRASVDNADHPEAAELFNPEKLPGFHDPFAGGGALPLEAQRLGMESYASDLNPVAVLINKAMIEIPPKFAGQPPVNPDSRNKLNVHQWEGAQGLSEDVRYYGTILKKMAGEIAGHLYPQILVTEKMASANETLAPYLNQSLTPIAYIWARTVPSPSPAHSHIHVPLASTFQLSRMKGKEAYVKILQNENGYEPLVCFGASGGFHAAKSGTKQARGANFRCVMSGDVITPKYIKEQGVNGKMGQRLLAVVAEGTRTRLYLSPDVDSEERSRSAHPGWAPGVDLPEDTRNFWTIRYGLSKFADLFTNRQLVSLGAFADCFKGLADVIAADISGIEENQQPASIVESGAGASDYAAAVCTYLAFAFSGMVDRMSSLCVWDPGGASWGTKLNHVFGRQSLPMTWDFAEANPFSSQTGSFANSLDYTSKGIAVGGPVAGFSFQADAAKASGCMGKVVSTDPPYYDNISYADLSDFFYVWLRRSLREFHQDLFPTVAVPKAEELVAAPYRHGGKDNAESFFLEGMTLAMGRIADQSNQLFPVTIYYAFKQAETKGATGTASTGWETFLAAVMEAGLSITGTWPMRTELANRMIGAGANALASSVVLVCERRDPRAAILSRNEFRRELRKRLPQVIKELEHANIAPVDVAQAAIGPGMAIFSQAKAVLNPDDSSMSVRESLIEINAALDEHLSKDDGSFDADSRFALTFFESYGYSERPYGDAEGLAVARNISVDGVARAGILRAIAGKVQLLRRDQLDDDWDPSRDERLCVWEATQHLIKRLDAGGEPAGAALLAQLKDLPGHGDLAANCRALAYRLYNHCEKTKQAEEARAYNGLVIAWPELEKLAAQAVSPVQPSLL